MNQKERKVQEAVGSLKVDEIRRTYDIQYLGPKGADPGFIVTVDGTQIPFTKFDDIMEYFGEQARDPIWDTFVTDESGEVVRDRVKHIEITVRITHTDA